MVAGFRVWVLVVVAATAGLLVVSLSAVSGATESWSQVGADIDGEAAYDVSGFAVSLSSDGATVAIGAIGNGGFAGHVRVFTNVGGVWTQVGNDIDGEAADDLSGSAVALSSDGTTVAIGARRNSGNGTSAGHVRVFTNVGGVWTQVGDDIDGEAAFDESGFAVALSSDGATVAIGARYSDGNGDFAGHVRVYRNVAGVWTKVGIDIDGEAAGDVSGWSVALSSDGATVAIGAPSNDGNGDRAGHVRVFTNDEGVWTQIGADIDGEAAGDESGWSVALSSDGATVAIGAPSNDGNGDRAGHVRVYRNVAGEWKQVANDIDGEATVDQSGWSVALSSDGATVAISAPSNDGNGNAAGHVRVFTNDEGVWTQVGGDIDGETAGDESGRALALSSDGAAVAIGAPSNDGNGQDAGHVRVFALPVPEVTCNGLVVTVDLSKNETPTAGDDVIRGTSGADTINALGGNDTICSLQGDDIVDGGDGFDKIFAGLGTDIITGGVGNDKLVGGPGNDNIRGGNGNDRIQGGDGDDVLYGENGLDRVAGGDGNDILRGGKFADELLGGLGRDLLYGGEGDDVLKGGAWIDWMNGGPQTDGCTLNDPSGNPEVRISCETGVFGL
jgi:Ca2+-binding RTX toxin-like protein